MLNLRLEVLSKKENAPFTRASASVEEEYGLYRESGIGVACKPDQWTAAMGVADQELRRALQFGFNPDELKQVAADFRNQLEQAVKTAPTRRSEELAGQIADSLVDRQVFTSPADDLALFGPALDKVTPEQCAEALRAAWASTGRYVFVSGNLKVAGDPNQIVADAFERAESVGVGRTDARASLAWDYTDFGKPGAVASKTHIDDLDITEVTFANGVRLNLKKTDFEANAIHVAARLGSGLLSEPSATKPGLSMFSTLTFAAGGLGRYGVDDLQRILAGKTVGLGFSSTPDAFLFNGQTNKEDLALELQLLAASISDPGYRAEAMRVARKRIDEAYLAFSHTERGPLSLEVPKLLSSGDPRFALPPKDEMMSRSLDELRAWLGPQLATGALEVSIAGDIDIDTAIEAAARTVGALPAREPKPALADRKKVSYPATPFTKEFGVDTKIPKGVVAAYWSTEDGMDIHRARRLNMLGQVLEDRLRVKVREQMGGTYSPQTQSNASDLYPGYGYMSALCVVDPAKTKLFEDAVVAAAADLCANGVTQDELDRAKNPTLKALKESERTNGYWMTVLGRAQERPEVLDWAALEGGGLRVDQQGRPGRAGQGLPLAGQGVSRRHPPLPFPDDGPGRETGGPGPVEASPAAGRRLRGPPQARPKTSEAFVPPNPKLFASAKSTRFVTAEPAVKSRPSAAHAGSMFSRLMVGGMTPFSIASTAAKAPSAPAAPSRCPVIDLTALTWSCPFEPPNRDAMAAASSPSPPGVDVAWAET